MILWYYQMDAIVEAKMVLSMDLYLVMIDVDDEYKHDRN